MAVLRVERYTGIHRYDQHHLRDKSLSLKAKGPTVPNALTAGGLGLHLSGLAVINRESKDARSAPQLSWKRRGYGRRRACNAGGGKFSANGVIYERPVTEDCPPNRCLQNRCWKNRCPGFPTAINRRKPSTENQRASINQIPKNQY